MKQKTKDLFLVYSMFAALIIILFIFSIQIKSCKKQQSTLKEQEELATVYDTPIQNPAVRMEVVQQLPDYPSGDEFAAAVSFLQAYGYNANIPSLIENMNYSANNFVESYVGDATTDTGYCYAPALVVCINNYLFTVQANMRTENMSGITWDHLKEYVAKNQPLIAWFTDDYNYPRFNDTAAYDNMRTVVIQRIENGAVTFIDSINGITTLPESQFQSIWEKCGSQCIGVYYEN